MFYIHAIMYYICSKQIEMKYQKKPVIIDAVQWTGKNQREMFEFLTQDTFREESMTLYDSHFYVDHNKVEGGLIIKTLEGEHLARIGDYIIKGVKGEFYPCKEDIFLQTYEKVENNPINLSLGDKNSTWGTTISGPNKVPYSTICSCNPANGGNGICGCTIPNTMVDNPHILKTTTGGLNTTTSSGTYTYLGSSPQLNGVKCPKCGKELMDTYPNMILTSDPPQKNVHCPKCDHKGYRFIL
jgi:DNA-directed RNA polymerase subunit RPC12/RpoP